MRSERRAGNAPSVTAAVIARDEARNLVDLLPSLRWADEILVVVDDATSDESVAVSEQLADHVVLEPFTSFPSFRNRALEIATGQWVFFIDADERVSDRLIDEVLQRVAASEAGLTSGDSRAPVGYWVPRNNLMFGRLIRGGGWSPDYQMRLFRRGSARYDPTRHVHEKVQLGGPEGFLSERLLHFNYATLGQFFAKQEVYTSMEAAALRAQGYQARARSLIGEPVREFLRRYVILGGWRDGPVGLFLSIAMAYFALRRTITLRSRDTAQS
ncbi:MAG: glycosyl transferase family 2 [Chloroflexi bacterium]|nr:glycosyl transferase family 2 [Chloroflexota bacterium]